MEHDRILGYFLEEANEHLNTIEQGLRKLPETVRQPTMIRELFRAAHSIKGSAAMLGLHEVQQIGNQFEANFKLLKEQPQIEVDKHLQMLFLASFSFLKAGIERVRQSSDPYRLDPAAADPIGDPVFAQLRAYLQDLLATANPTVPVIRERDRTQDPAVEQVFGEYVTRKLAEIIDLCLQPDRPEIRTQIQQICQKLGNLGENFDFLEWTNLFTACRLAIANPANFLPQLGESISIAVKQAQILIVAHRHQDIGITPDLEAAIDYQNRIFSGDLFAGNNIVQAPSQKLPDLLAISDRLEPINFDRPDNLAGLFALPNVEFAPDAMELNEFMNPLSDEIPTEGMWMQDDDFLAGEPLLALGETVTATSSSQIFEPVSPPNVDPAPDLALAIEQVNVSGDNRRVEVSEYDEETFYTPDLDGIDDLEIANFWLDPQLSPPQPPYADLDSLDLGDYQFQPDLGAALELDVPAPAFSLDPPISGLFPTIAPPENWEQLEESPLSSQVVPPVASIAEATGNDLDLNGLLPAQTIRSAAPEETQIESIAEPLQRGIEIPQVTNEIAAATLDLLWLEELTSSKPELAIADAPTPPTSISWLDNSIEQDRVDDFDDLQLDILSSSQPVGDLSSGDDFAGLDINPLGISGARINPAVGEDFTELEFSFGSNDSELSAIDRDLMDLEFSFSSNDLNLGSTVDRDLMDLDFSSFDTNDLDIGAIDGNLEELDLNPLGMSDLEINSSLDRNLLDLDLNFNNSNSDANSSLGVELDLNPLGISDREINSSLDRDLEELDLNPSNSDLNYLLDRNGELNPNPLNTSNLDVSFPFDRDLLGLDLNLVGTGDLEFDSALDGELELELKPLGISELEISATLDRIGESDLNPSIISDLEINSEIERNFADLDLDFELQNDNNFADLDLDFLSSDRSDLNLFASDDFGGLDRNFLNEIELDSASITSATLPDSVPSNLNMLDVEVDLIENRLVETGSPTNNDPSDFNLDIFSIDDLGLESSVSDDFADLDFNFDGLSAVPSDESIDFGNISIQVGSNLTDAVDLDALLGVASGADAALTGAGLEFDDLDALMTAVPTTELAANLDDILGDSLTETVNRSLETLPSVNPPAPNTAQKPPDRRAKQSRTFEQTMRVSVRHLNNLNNLVGELVVNRNTLEQDQNRMRQFVEKLLSEVQKLNEVGKRMQDLYERSLMENSLVASRQQSKPALNPQLGSEDVSATGTSIEYDPLEMDRFTPIHLLSQKMIELTVRVRESTADIEFVVDGSTEVTRTLRQITGQLQEDLTKSRMLPFAQTADRLQRGVRDNGLKYGKQIELSVEGRDTLIDKVILESLADPLIHMVNNAIAHGIESTETRLAVGKSSEGKITIRAIHQGNQTIISISDDGAGIDTQRVKAKAIQKGIITAQQAATMSKTEAYDLLFLPSFSTKDKADELSGRGVGMDVVRTSITEIRGTITTESQLGVGTTFTIRLPLALSIAKALIAVNNKRNIAFPMDGIEDTQDVSPKKIQMNSEGKQCIFWRDELMPFTPLSDLLEFNRPLARNNFYSTNEDDSDLVSILILRSDGNLTAVQVDKITGDQEIVIKPLQGPASKPLGIAGATVMGDGRIIPIVDVMELIALAQGTLSRQVSTEWTSQMTVPTVEVRESMVLIVDDSITVRELLSLTFKRAGYRVEQARDGQEAWDKLRAGLPCDIVFCDIEMPRMDGLEFLSRIQKDPALIKIPIAMLTSRGSDRHRQIASQLGASGYFIKPYLEEALLDAAKRMIEGEVLEIV
ncbi:MAG: response regulator [Chamaesiphon sp.]|nr:response regulator [Chamaesiphon sp.]